MSAVMANGITLEVERHGSSNAPALVMIRGLGSQLIHWPNALIQRVVASGFQVITFDNRDSGLSQKFENTEGYSLRDMAADTVGLMDALGLEAAHLLGLSMGGMILQLIALHYPQRVLSACIIMSSSRAPNLPQADAEVQEMLRAPAPSDRRADVIAHELWTGRAFQSPAWPFDDAERADLIGRAYDRCYCPDGTQRQYAAMMAAAKDLTEIERITVPTLVIHGTDDRLLPPAHGRDIAARISKATLIEIDGMGHDLAGAPAKISAGHIADFILKVTKLSVAHK